jgi:hypothetical protein
MLGFFTIFYHFYYPKTHLLQVAFLWQTLLYNYLWTGPMIYTAPGTLDFFGPQKSLDFQGPTPSQLPS